MSRPSLEKTIISQWYANADISALTDLQKQNFQFAISSNERALSAIKLMEAHGIVFKDANVLDIGCAYGGYTIEARRRGAAVAYGVDISELYIAIAESNLSDETDDFRQKCKFIACDITSEKSSILPDNYFNIIIMNDVFEHIYDTSRLMSVINRVAASECDLFFQIPNGLHFFDFVEKEPHYHKYGMSILDPAYCTYKDVFYRRWEYFAALFSYWGFGDILLFNSTSSNKKQLQDYILVKLESVELSLRQKFANDTTELGKMVICRLEEFRSELLRDIEVMETGDLNFKYLTSFWEGVARRHKRNRKISDKIAPSGNYELSVRYSAPRITTLMEKSWTVLRRDGIAVFLRKGYRKVRIAVDVRLAAYGGNLVSAILHKLKKIVRSG